MQESFALEVIALSVDDALAAAGGGATRLELTATMEADGLTPDPETVRAVRRAVDLPLRVMLRPATGFILKPSATVLLFEQLAALKDAGAQDFVLGFLTIEGMLDLSLLQRLDRAVAPGWWTLHRAFDAVQDGWQAWQHLSPPNRCDLILTAGSSLGVDAGWGTLQKRANWASPGKSWVIGGGLREEHLSALWRWGYRQFHVGRAARRDGQWSSHVEQQLVRVWRDHLDDLAQTRW
ncbi:MAG: copper homeostasis protein CutC [Chloroflexi bacterium]|nr:copper homeostasis protein CutC [Chloroflexota bacterium]